MKNCNICGERHNGNTVHRFVGEGGIELITKEQASMLLASKRNPNWGFIPALK